MSEKYRFLQYRMNAIKIIIMFWRHIYSLPWLYETVTDDKWKGNLYATDSGKNNIHINISEKTDNQVTGRGFFNFANNYNLNIYNFMY